MVRRYDATRNWKAPCILRVIEDRPSPEKKSLRTCTIITTEPNDIIRPIHDRMSVMARKELEDFWIDPHTHSPNELLSMLKPHPAEKMAVSETTIRKHGSMQLITSK
jgi:putative SOS response-associated peptidase YedK